MLTAIDVKHLSWANSLFFDFFSIFLWSNVQNMICLMASRIVFCRLYCRHFCDHSRKSHAITANYNDQNEPLSVSFWHQKEKLVFCEHVTIGASGPPILTYRGPRLALYGASGAYSRLVKPRSLKFKKLIRIQKVWGWFVHLKVFSLQRPI